MGAKEAEKFYVEKLENYPSMSRYNHLLAAIYSDKKESEKADYNYRFVNTNVRIYKKLIIKNEC